MSQLEIEAFTEAQVRALHADGRWQESVLTDHLDHWAHLVPDATYVIDAELGIERSYAQVRGDAYRLAAALRQIGLRKGDRVGLQLPNWHEFPVVYFAFARLGLVTVPMMTIYRHKELRHITGLTELRALVTVGTFRGFDHLTMARQVQQENPTLEHLIVVRGTGVELRDGEQHLEAALDRPEPAADELGPAPGADDAHLIAFTSGTESSPKGCLHTWNTYSYTPRHQVEVFDFDQGSRELMPSPVAHTAGLAAGLLKPLIGGGSVCLMDAWDPTVALDNVDRWGCTHSTGATTFLAMMSEAFDPERHDASTFVCFTCGGAPVPPAVVRSVAQTFPRLNVLACYGMTEALMVTACRLDDDDDVIISTDGSPWPGVEVAVVDETGEPLPAGEEGEIVYRSPGAMLGYWRNPEATAAVVAADGWRRSGDLGRMTESGYLRVTGRVKEMIIRGGLNISTREIEEMIEQHEDVHEVAVVGLPDGRLGERACAVLVPAEGKRAPTLQELADFLLDRFELAKQKLPERVEVVDALPRTPTGKIKKAELRGGLLAPAPETT